MCGVDIESDWALQIFISFEKMGFSAAHNFKSLVVNTDVAIE